MNEEHINTKVSNTMLCNCSFNNGCLHKFTYSGNVKLIKFFISGGADINSRNDKGNTPLICGCEHGNVEINHRTIKNWTSLMIASMCGNLELASILINSGARMCLDYCNLHESALSIVASRGYIKIAELLLNQGTCIDHCNKAGYTPLMEATRVGDEEMVDLLLRNGAFTDFMTNETEETALTLACTNGYYTIVKKLINASADIEEGNLSPLMVAAKNGHLKIVKLLLDSAATTNLPTCTGYIALTYACELGYTDIAELLLEFGSELEYETKEGLTPLMMACCGGYLDMVKYLISKGANVNHQAKLFGHTPLSFACIGGHVSVVRELLKHGADPYKLKDDETMLLHIKKAGHNAVIELLQ